MSIKFRKVEVKSIVRKARKFDGHTIYLVYIKEYAKVIKIKNLYIYKDYKSKDITDLATYKDIFTF